MNKLFARASTYYKKHGLLPSARLIYRKLTGRVPWNIRGPRPASYIADHGKVFAVNPAANAVQYGKVVTDEIDLGPAERIVQPVNPAPGVFGTAHVLIIGDLNLPQCRKYRVVQKVEALHKMGLVANYSHWEDIPRCINLMQVATTVILYRVQYSSLIEQYCGESRRLGIAIGYDIDDPVFDAKTYAANKNLDALKPQEKRSLLGACPYYAQAIQLADFTIVSTPGMIEVMKTCYAGPIYLWRNAIDIETRQAALSQFTFKEPDKKGITIGYASGSRAHNLDFAVAEPALIGILNEYPEVELAIIGYHTPSEQLEVFEDRITHIEFQGYAPYISGVAKFDISLIPLLLDPFNDCKSAIRFLESAIVRVPAVASNIGDFRNLVEDGVTGFLAATTEDWYQAIVKLIENPDLRSRIGAAAQDFVTRQMHSETIAANLDPSLLRIIRND